MNPPPVYHTTPVLQFMGSASLVFVCNGAKALSFNSNGVPSFQPVINKVKWTTPMSKFVRAAIYTRVSTTGQAQDGHSLDEQFRQCKQLLEMHGHDFVVHYSDVGSGSNFEARPGYQEMMGSMRQAWDIVYVWKLDRLNRNLKNQVQFFDTIGKNDAYIASVTEQVQTDSPYGRFIINVMSSLAQMEREQISERVSMGIGAARSQGRYIGGCPYGYSIPVKYDESGNRVDKGQLVVNDDEAPIVRLIFEKHLEDFSIGEICNFLVENGYRTRKNKVIWSYGTVANILSRWHLYLHGKEKQDGESRWDPIIFLNADEARKLEQAPVEGSPYDEGLSVEEEIHSQMKIADMVVEEHPNLLKDPTEEE